MFNEQNSDGRAYGWYSAGLPQEKPLLSQEEQRKLKVLRYWPEAEGRPIGFAVSRAMFVGVAMGLAIFGLGLLGQLAAGLGWFPGWLYYSRLPELQLLSGAGLVAMAWGIALGYKQYGHYELDESGQPVRFISHRRPVAAQGRSTSSRTEFLVRLVRVLEQQIRVGL